VLYVSLHRYGNGFYPGTGALEEVGEGAGAGFNVNVPWAGAYTRPLFRSTSALSVACGVRFGPSYRVIRGC
jgi:acetoin utilization deacetylase AcuC-like enzyme